MIRPENFVEQFTDDLSTSSFGLFPNQVWGSYQEKRPKKQGEWRGRENMEMQRDIKRF